MGGLLLTSLSTHGQQSTRHQHTFVEIQNHKLQRPTTRILHPIVLRLCLEQPQSCQQRKQQFCHSTMLGDRL
jgi:hypothetical protein